MIIGGTKRETIEKWSLLYGMLKPIVDFIFRTYFKTYSYKEETFNKDDILIYAPNHQNALMDALAILATYKGEPVFLARADIFEKKTISKILTFLKILPIYRIRDGKTNLQNNDAIFQKTIDVLKERKRLTILPEGNHAGRRKLRTVKKGISRIAFQAEEATDFSMGIKIVPVGLDYQHYYHVQSRLTVYYGKAIPLEQFVEEYKANPPRGMNLLREEVGRQLKKYMVHIESEAYYVTIDTLAKVCGPLLAKKRNGKNFSKLHLLKAEQSIATKYDQLAGSEEKIKPLASKVEKYKHLIKKFKFRYWVIRRAPFCIFNQLGHALLQLVSLPFFIYGAINNIIPYSIPIFITRKVKDAQFISSFRMVVAMLLFFIFYITQTVLFASLTDFDWWVKVLYPLSLYPTGLIALHHYTGWKKLTSKLRYSWLKITNNKDFKTLIELHNEIVLNCQKTVK